MEMVDGSSQTAAPKNGSRGRHLVSKRRVAEYDYFDESGELQYQIVRYELELNGGGPEKSFAARRRPRSGESARSDGWVYNLDGVQLLPYNLPALKDEALVYIVEGEKDVETLARLGIAATCNPLGAGRWRPEFGQWLSSKTAVILPDNDEAGRKHALTVAASIYETAKEVLIIGLPGLPPKGDVTDFVQAGGTIDDLIDLVGRAEPWTPPPSDAEAPFSRLRFTRLNELLREPTEDVSFIWEQTLPTGGFSICSAKPKVGKSTLARNLAVAVARGESFLGRPTKKGKVLYLCLEEKRSEIANHFRKMGVDSDQILIYTGTTPKDVLDDLKLSVAEHVPVLVVIDPLSRVLRVPDFNDYGAMARGLEPLIDLARVSECHILALHHDSKMDRSGGDALLGSTALFGAVDCHIQLKKREGGRTLLTTQRYGDDIPETVIELNKETGTVSATGDLSEFIRRKAKEAILAEIGDVEELNEGTIKGRVEGFSHGEIAKALRELVGEERLNRKGEGVRGKPFMYSHLRRG
jgi:hypothetical protein